MRIMITNGGPHPPEAWAVITAEQLFPLDNDIPPSRRVAALQLQAKVAAALVRPHQAIADKERAALSDDEARFEAAHRAEDEDLDAAMEAVKSAAQGTPWADHVNKPEVQREMRTVLAKHFATSQHVHRLVHADKNPNSEGGKKYRAAFRGKED